MKNELIINSDKTDPFPENLVDSESTLQIIDQCGRRMLITPLCRGKKVIREECAPFIDNKLTTDITSSHFYLSLTLLAANISFYSNTQFIRKPLKQVSNPLVLQCCL